MDTRYSHPTFSPDFDRNHLNMVQLLNHVTRLIAGDTVPDTALINASIALAQQSLPTDGFNHVMRAWLNGQALINHLPSENRSAVDTEALSVAAILHDLGWYAAALSSHCIGYSGN